VNIDEMKRDNRMLRERMSRLSAAALRINASLEVGTVLEEIVESARELTGARYGAIVSLDDSGGPEDFVTSGATAEEHRRMSEWPEGPRLFDLLRSHPGVMTEKQMPPYVEALGRFSEIIRPMTFQGTLMRYRDADVGYFCLAEKEGGLEFTPEDEEVLLLFAGQAAVAIANARTHREEQRTRADLEALVDTSPVGVAVLDAQTGKVTSLNREARRIFSGLQLPDGSPEELLELVSLRRADGHEIAAGEFLLARELSTAETVRFEEITLSVADGRSVTTLVNSTPIRSGDGAVESVVVTMQDLAPLEELERQRAEFLGIVSHELRAPLTSIKGSTTTVLGRSADMERAEWLQFLRIIDQQADHMDGLISDLLDAGRIEAGNLSVNPQPMDVASLVDGARSTFLSGGGRHAIRIDLPQDLPRVMADRRRVVQVLNNLFSNAARHSSESSAISVEARVDGMLVEVSVSDEGEGVPPGRLPHLFRKYTALGTRDRERGATGHGLGLAICKGLVEAHGGRIRAESRGLHQGTRISFTLPVAEGAATGAAGPARDRAVRSSGRRRDREPILVVDDDPQILRYVRDALIGGGYAPLVSADPDEIPRIIESEGPKLILLDLILPGTDGVELMERLPQMADLPVIFISAYGRDETIARALEFGAADYIVKPFSATELVARVRAALRKRASAAPLVVGDLTIDYERRRVTVAGAPVDLTATEFELFRALAANGERVSTYDYLLRRVWSGRDTGNRKLVRTFVKKLRRKLGDAGSGGGYILNERGVGYRMSFGEG